MTKSHGKFFFGHVDSLAKFFLILDPPFGPQQTKQLTEQQIKHVVPESQGWSIGFFVVGKVSDEFSVVVSIIKTSRNFPENNDKIVLWSA